MNPKSTPYFTDMVISQKLISGEWHYDPESGKLYNRAGKVIRGSLLNDYIIVGTSFYGEYVNALYHRIIWIATHDYIVPECGMQIDHINGIKTDNRPENLRLVTPKENANNPNAPSQRTGERSSNAHLTNATAAEILTEWNSTRDLPKGVRPTTRSLAEKYGVSKSTIRNLVNGETYPEVSQCIKIEVYV